MTDSRDDVGLMASIKTLDFDTNGIERESNSEC